MVLQYIALLWSAETPIIKSLVGVMHYVGFPESLGRTHVDLGNYTCATTTCQHRIGMIYRFML